MGGLVPSCQTPVDFHRPGWIKKVCFTVLLATYDAKDYGGYSFNVPRSHKKIPTAVISNKGEVQIAQEHLGTGPGDRR